tara:strand:+ start:38 stop:295 length:258 start_codon:yes stop_codon:yes gene_type:complete
LSDINISGSLTLPYIDKCINQECMKIWNDFWHKCQGAQSPPNENCCKQSDIFYPMYDTCKNILIANGEELVSKEDLLNKYNICNP